MGAVWVRQVGRSRESFRVRERRPADFSREEARARGFRAADSSRGARIRAVRPADLSRQGPRVRGTRPAGLSRGQIRARGTRPVLPRIRARQGQTAGPSRGDRRRPRASAFKTARSLVISPRQPQAREDRPRPDVPSRASARPARRAAATEAAPRVRGGRQTARAGTQTDLRAAEIRAIREIGTEAASRAAVMEAVRADSREETEAAREARAIRAAVTEAVRADSREETEAAREARAIRGARAETVPRASQAVPADLTATEAVLAARVQAVRADFRGETGTVPAAGSRAATAAVPVPADVPSQAVPVRRTFPSPLTRQWLQNHRATEAIKMPIRMINTTRGI